MKKKSFIVPAICLLSLGVLAGCSNPSTSSEAPKPASSEETSVPTSSEQTVVEVTKVELSAPKTELTVGEEMVLTVKVLPENATDKTVTLTSSDPKKLSCDGMKVKALAKTEANAPVIVTAQSKNGKTSTLTISIKEAAPKMKSITVRGLEGLETLKTNTDYSLSITCDPWTMLEDAQYKFTFVGPEEIGATIVGTGSDYILRAENPGKVALEITEPRYLDEQDKPLKNTIDLIFEKGEEVPEVIDPEAVAKAEGLLDGDWTLEGGTLEFWKDLTTNDNQVSMAISYGEDTAEGLLTITVDPNGGFLITPTVEGSLYINEVYFPIDMVSGGWDYNKLHFSLAPTTGNDVEVDATKEGGEASTTDEIAQNLTKALWTIENPADESNVLDIWADTSAGSLSTVGFYINALGDTFEGTLTISEDPNGGYLITPAGEGSLTISDMYFPMDMETGGWNFGRLTITASGTNVGTDTVITAVQAEIVTIDSIVNQLDTGNYRYIGDEDLTPVTIDLWRDTNIEDPNTLAYEFVYGTEMAEGTITVFEDSMNGGFGLEFTNTTEFVLDSIEFPSSFFETDYAALNVYVHDGSRFGKEVPFTSKEDVPASPLETAFNEFLEGTWSVVGGGESDYFEVWKDTGSYADYPAGFALSYGDFLAEGVLEFQEMFGMIVLNVKNSGALEIAEAYFGSTPEGDPDYSKLILVAYPDNVETQITVEQTILF